MGRREIALDEYADPLDLPERAVGDGQRARQPSTAVCVATSASGDGAPEAFDRDTQVLSTPNRPEVDIVDVRRAVRANCLVHSEASAVQLDVPEVERDPGVHQEPRAGGGGVSRKRGRRRDYRPGSSLTFDGQVLINENLAGGGVGALLDEDGVASRSVVNFLLDRAADAPDVREGVRPADV